MRTASEGRGPVSPRQEVASEDSHRSSRVAAASGWCSSSGCSPSSRCCPLGSKLADETTDDTESFLPASAESTEVVRNARADFPQRRDDTGLIVYKRDRRTDGRRQAEDRRRRAGDPGRRAGQDRPGEPPLSRSPAKRRRALVSPQRRRRRHGADHADQLRQEGDWGKDGPRHHRHERGRDAGLRDRRPRFQRRRRGGLRRHRHQAAAGATVLLVLVLLGAIYRSPLVALTPLIVVVLRLHGRPGLHLPATRSRARPSPRTRPRS